MGGDCPFPLIPLFTLSSLRRHPWYKWIAIAISNVRRHLFRESGRVKGYVVWGRGIGPQEMVTEKMEELWQRGGGGR